MFYLRFKKKIFEKNDQIAHFRSFSLISSFLGRDVSESLISLKSNERSERIAHFANHRLGLSKEMSNVSETLISLTENERMSESLNF